MTTEELDQVRRAQAGDTEAFAWLVARHQKFAYNLALRALSNGQEAEDAAQDAFVRAWLALPNFRGQSQFRTWLYRIVTNVCYNRLPRLRRELSALGDDRSDDIADSNLPEPGHSLEHSQRREVLNSQIDILPESYKMLITLRYQQELSYEDIAAVLSIPLGTVKTGLFRAKAQLRKALADYETDDQ